MISAPPMASASASERPVLPVAVRAGDDEQRRIRHGRRRAGRSRVRAGRLGVRGAAHPTSRPTSAYGPARSIRARTSWPTMSRSPARCTSRFSRLRPVSWGATASGCSRRSPRGRATRRTWTDSTRTSVSRPTQRWLRSRPIASWTASRALQPAPLLRRRHVVGQARCRRSRAGREGRREDLVVADLAQQVQRRLELRLGLAAEADDDVGRQADARDRRRAAAPTRPR